MNQKILDFRSGKNRWGHALHSSTMTDIKPSGFFDRIKDFLQSAKRYSFIVHCSQYPSERDIVLWSTLSGDRKAEIIRVKSFCNTDDMFTLFVRITPSGRQDLKGVK